MREMPPHEVNISGSRVLITFEDGATLSCPHTTEAARAVQESFAYWTEGPVLVLVSTLGILGNTLSGLILGSKGMRNSFNILLIALAVYDNTYLMGAILESLRKSFDAMSDLHVILFPYFLYPLHQTSMTGSIFMTVAIAFERYTAVFSPINYSLVSKERNP